MKKSPVALLISLVLAVGVIVVTQLGGGTWPDGIPSADLRAHDQQNTAAAQR